MDKTNLFGEVLPEVKMSRTWAMPNSKTFSIPPVRKFVDRYTDREKTIVDPFARNCETGTVTNDLNPDTKAQYHMKAHDFLQMLINQGVKSDVVLFDPPYSPRQITECYAGVGIKTTQKDTQASFYTELRGLVLALVKPGGLVLSFGWNSTGMGKDGFVMLEILLVAHGGAHNDTICVAQKKL